MKRKCQRINMLYTWEFGLIQVVTMKRKWMRLCLVD